MPIYRVRIRVRISNWIFQLGFESGFRLQSRSSHAKYYDYLLNLLVITSCFLDQVLLLLLFEKFCSFDKVELYGGN